jgi:hypothetical protein
MQTQRLGIFISIAVASLGVVAVLWYLYNGTRTSSVPTTDVPATQTSGSGFVVPESIEQVDTAMRTALQNSDIAAIQDAPVPGTLPTETTADAQRLFNLAQEQYAFGRSNEALAYLTPLLDSPSEAFGPFKSAAGYLLLRITADTDRGAVAIKDAVAKSSYMRALTPRAEKVFPRVFENLPASTDTQGAALYFVSYLVALGETATDTIAVPANIALELLRVYDAPDTSAADKAIYAPDILKGMQRAQVMVGERVSSVVPVSAYDTVAGLNALAVAIDMVHYSGLPEFNEVAKADVLQLLDLSRTFAQQKVPLLTSHTSYLNALYGARYLEVSERNDKRINTFMTNILGPAPFDKLNEYSWAMKYLADAKSGAYTNPYARENIALIASRSENLRAFLTLKDGWTDADFKITATSTAK